MEPSLTEFEIPLAGVDEIFAPFALPGVYGRVRVTLSLDRAKALDAVLTHAERHQTSGPKFAVVTKPLMIDGDRMKRMRQKLRDAAGNLSLKIVPCSVVTGHFKDGFLELVEVSSAEQSNLGLAKVFP